MPKCTIVKETPKVVELVAVKTETKSKKKRTQKSED